MTIWGEANPSWPCSTRVVLSRAVWSCQRIGEGLMICFRSYQFGELKEPPESPKKKNHGALVEYEQERQGPAKPKSSYHFFRQLDCWF